MKYKSFDFFLTVAALKMNETLKELFLGDNKFMPTDGVQIGNLLKYNHKLELLDLRNNHLQVKGLGIKLIPTYRSVYFLLAKHYIMVDMGNTPDE